MEIVFPNEHYYGFTCDVIEFPAVVDGERVLCTLKLEEMIGEFRRGNIVSFHKDFIKLRPQIEQRAKRQLEKG